MKKIIFLIISVIFLVVAIIYSFYNENSKIFSIRVANTKELEKIKSKRTLFSDYVELYYNDNLIPFAYEENNNSFYLLSQVNDYNYIGVITNKNGYKIRVIKNDKNKYDLIKNNEAISIILYNDLYYQIVNLKMTTLPVISLTFKEEKDKIDSYGVMKLYDPYSNERENILNITDMNVRYHIRGATSRVSPKKSYKINVVNKDKEKKKVKLLGLREDNDWILNSIHLDDDSYMREKIGYDVWNALSDKYNHNMEYVEFIKDNNYQGIYYLQEPVDMKTFDGNDEDLLISVKKWKSLGRALYKDYEIDYEDLTRIDEMYFEKGLIENDSLKVELLRTFIPLFDYRYTYKSNIKMSYDIDNSVNHNLFLNLIHATDNNFKNQKIFFDKEVDNEYIIRRTPWDLDHSMNNEKHRLYDLNEILPDEILDPKIENSREFRDLLKNKYFEIRKTIYNLEKLYELVDNYKSLLENNGAVKRDKLKWESEENGIIDFEKSCQIIKDFYKIRIEVLDRYYGGL